MFTLIIDLGYDSVSNHFLRVNILTITLPEMQYLYISETLDIRNLLIATSLTRLLDGVVINITSSTLGLMKIR